MAIEQKKITVSLPINLSKSLDLKITKRKFYKPRYRGAARIN